MFEVSLSARLSAVANYVRFNSIAADVGTDHGQLICWLMQNKIINKGFACDINVYPLQRAQMLINSLGLEEDIELVLTDGLNGLEGRGITDFAIAGMGGELIANIIDGSPWIKNPDYNLILQPMSRDYKLRQYLVTNGFKIISETPVLEGKFTYTVMQVVYTGIRVEISYHYAWSGEIWYHDDCPSIDYLKSRLNIIEQMKPSFKEDSEYWGIIDQWKERIEQCCQ